MNETPAMGTAGVVDSAEFDEQIELPTVWERIDWIAVVALMVISLVLVGLHVRAYPTLSPFDELQHIDYVIKAGDFAPPHRNDLVGDAAMSEAACRGVDAPLYVGPPCDLEVYDPADFQENGVNTAAGQFPFYYTATGVVSRVAASVGLIGSQVTAARLVGALWVGAAWGIMWYVLALLRIPRAHRTVSLALLMATPLTLFHAATVNADAALMLIGALCVLAALQFERRRLHWAVLVAVFAGLYLVEATAVLAVAAMSAYLIARVSTRRDESLARRSVPVVALVMMMALRLEIASAIQRALFPASPRISSPNMFVVNAAENGVEYDRVLAQIDSLFSPVHSAYVPPFMSSQQTTALIDMTNWILVGAMFACFAGLVGSGTWGRRAWLGRIGAAALIAAGPFYTFSFAYFSNADFDVPGRFALPLIVFLVIGLASVMQSRWAFGAAAVVAVLAGANTLWLLVTP